MLHTATALQAVSKAELPPLHVKLPGAARVAPLLSKFNVILREVLLTVVLHEDGRVDDIVHGGVVRLARPVLRRLNNGAVAANDLSYQNPDDEHRLSRAGDRRPSCLEGSCLQSVFRVSCSRETVVGC